MDRSIIHINIADFAVAIERRIDPRLSGRPVIIAPEGALRATVYDMSEEAFRAGVRKGMALRRAARLCRDAAVLPPHPARYEQGMAELLRQTLPYSPLIEPGEADGHLFVDVTGTSRLFGPPVDVAWRLRRQARRELGLDPIWSLAASKLVAKVASRLVKPVGEYIVAPGEEQEFLAPLPVWLIPGFEGPDLDRLRALNLQRVEQVTRLTRAQLEVALGGRAAVLGDALRGVDQTPVLPLGQQPPRVILDHTFGTDTNIPAQVENALYALLEQAARRLREQSRAARRIAIRLEYSDGRRCVRQMGIEPASANELTVFPLARRVLGLAWSRRVRVRHLRLTLDRLVYPPAQAAQLFLFDEDADARNRAAARRNHIVAVLDKIRDRFGDQVVGTGRRLGSGTDSGIAS